jgi:branched-chain amino acid transport system permease protein
MDATDTTAVGAARSLAEARARAIAFLAHRHHFRIWEALPWLLALAAFFLFPDRMAFGSQVLLMVLFALSLDLILGYAGIVSLGHAAFFGLGAYTAGLLSVHGWGEPITGLIAAAAVLGAVCSLLILRGSDLTRLMVTLGVALILYELANKLDWLTGGADGLQGVVMAPLATPFGRFEFDLYGRTAYAYSLVVLAVCLFISRRLVNSPFGFSLQALRDNRLRAASIGLSVNARLVAVYTVAAAMAGAAGALLAQTSGFASLDVFDFHRSAEVLLALVIGGTGYLYGGIFGAIAFKLLQDVISGWTPQYWNFWLGLFLVILVLVGRERLIRPWRWWPAKGAR